MQDFRKGIKQLAHALKKTFILEKAFTKEAHREPTTRNSDPNGALRCETLHKDNALIWEEE